MTGILIALAIILGLILIVISFVVYKANKFKNRVEETAINSIKKVIEDHGPDAVKYVKNKIERK